MAKTSCFWWCDKCKTLKVEGPWCVRCGRLCCPLTPPEARREVLQAACGAAVAEALLESVDSAADAAAGEGGAGVSTIGPVELEVTP